MTIARSNSFGSSRKAIVPSPADLVNATRGWLHRRAKRAEIRDLLTLDRDRLADMGLTRGDVHEALAAQGDACANLRALASHRRGARNW